MNNNNKEIRSFEIRSNTESRHISGYSVVFNSMSENLGGFREIIAPTAINDELLRISDVVMNYAHDDNLILARSRNGEGTLSLKIDERGLLFEFDMPNSDLGDRVLESIRRGDINKCSFAFSLPDNDTCETWEKREDGTIVRTIHEIGGLYDCAIVAHPAYNGTEVSARSIEMINKLNNDNMTEENKTLRNDENPNEDEEKKEETQNEENEEQKNANCDDDENRSDEENEEETQEENTSDENTDDEEENKQETSEDETEEKEHKNINKQISMEKKNFSLLKAIREVANGQTFDDVTASVINSGKEIMRNSGVEMTGQIQLPVGEQRATITVTTEHDDVIEVEMQDILAPLQDNLVLVNAGARYISNLIGDIQFPTISASQVGWVGEISAASDGGNTFGNVKLTPKRLSAYVDVSKQFLVQDSIGAENMIRSLLVEAIGQKLEETILGTAQGSSTKPQGLGYGLTPEEVSDFAGICAVEASLEDANFWNGGHYVMSPSAKAALRSMIKGTNGTGMVMEDGEVDGTPAEITNHVADNCFYYGDFSNLVIGQWGVLDLTVDPFTKATTGEVRLVINAYFDAKLVRSGAIALGEIVAAEEGGEG